MDNPKNLKTYGELSARTCLIQVIASGYEFGLIAQGKLDGRICLDPYGDDWDFAPGALLVQEAGGIVTNIGSETYDYTNHNFITSNKTIHHELTHGPNALFAIAS